MTLPRSNRRLTLRTATVLLALVALAILLVGTPTASADDPPQVPESGPVFDIQGLPLEGKVSPSKYLNLGSNLNHVVEQARTGRLTTRAAAASAPIHHGHSVAVTLYIIEGYADTIASYLEANGASPRNIGADYIEAYIPVSLLEEASRQEGVLSIRTIIPPQPEQGTVVSGGVAAHGVTSWHAAGFKGRGVKIGVIDLSFEGFAGLMGSELPATVNTRCYTSAGNFTSNLSDCISTSSPESHRLHGTAVTEAIFDIAPQADYYIADTSSYGDLLNTVNWMASQGVDVINMSLGWTFDGPGDGTAYYSNAPLDSVDTAVRGGIIWVNAAGNSAKDSWYGAFEDSDSDGVHQFNASGNECNGVTIDLDPLEGFTAQLRWADSWGGASKDLDLYLIPVSGGTISLSDAVAASVDYQSGYINHIPYEWISRRHGQLADGEYCFAVNQASGAAPSWIQILVWGASGDLQNYVSARSIGNPAESRNPGMLAAGAARVSNTSTIESFSSRGPTTDNRTKPDIVGADGGTSSTYGTWYGTSQASPHVAGLAALVKQAYPSRSPSSIASYLKDNALGRDTVPNNTWGYGFAQLPTPPTEPANSAATGVPTITGTAEVGATLTADTSGIVDLDGLDNVSFSYQWIRSDSTTDWDVDGATGAAYTVAAADVDKTIKVRVSFTDDADNVESLTSSATVAVPEATVTLKIEGTTVTCDSYNVKECDDPSSIDQGLSGEIEVEIEIARSVTSQLYKFDFRISQIEDSIGNSGSVEANDLCLGPGLADSALIETTPDDGTGPFTYTDDGTIFELCPAGTYQLYVYWYRYNYTDQEYEYAGTFRRYFFITSDDEEDTSIERVKWITALYPDPPASHDDVQVEATKESEVLNRELATFSLSIDGLVPDSDSETADYVVRVRIIGDDGPRKIVPWCHVGNVGYSYLLKTVPEDGGWAMKAHLKGSCISHSWPDTLQIELFNGSYEYLAGKDVALGAPSNNPAAGAPTISGTAQVGETLTVDTSGIDDEDGLANVSFSYQWLANDAEIVGATDPTYTLVDDDAGLTIKVKVSFFDDKNNPETLTSAATAAVLANVPGAPEHLNVSPHDTGALDVSWEGPARDGGSDITGYKVQWKRVGDNWDAPADVSEETVTGTTHTITGLTDGVEYAVRIIAVNDVGDGPPSDEATGTPRETTPPELSTATVDGATLTLTYDEDLDENSEPSSDAFSVTVGGTGRAVDGVSVSGSSVILTLGSAVTAEETVTVSYAAPADTVAPRIRDLAGNATASFTSHAVTNNTPKPNSPATGQPTITGTAQVGETLVADIFGIGDDDGLPAESEFDYQWIRNDGSTDANIAGATDSTYVLLAADVGKFIKVQVTFTDKNDYTETLTSAATTEVAVAAPAPGPIIGFTVVDASDQSVEGALADGGTLALDDPVGGSFGIRADLESGATIGSMSLHLTGAKTHDQTENIAPYSLYGDSGGNLSGESLPVGEYTLTATAYSEARLGGNVLGTLKVSFSVTETATQQPNTPATGLPTITGTAQVGETLTADISGIGDDDGLPAESEFDYQWIAGTTDISGATGSSYAPLVADLDKTIKVRVSFDDDRNFLETLTSEATATVTAAVTPLTAGFQDAPDSHDGTSAFTFRIAFSEPISISYKTLRDDSLEVTNGSATKAKRVNGQSDLWEIMVEPDSDAAVTVVLPITEDCGAQGAVCSRAGGNERRPLSNRSELTVPGPAAANSPATGAPIISGTARVGETLTVDTSGIDDADGMSGAVFSYQWLANDAEITGATSDTYTLVEVDVGKAVKVRVIFNDDDANEETLTSEATAAVAAETAVPDAPRSLNVSPDDTGTLDVSWEAPASDGGSAITGYKVQWKSGSEDFDGSAGSTRQAEITDPASRTHTITGLTDGVEYTVRVIAVNDEGDGPPSDEATATPRETTPPELSTATVDGTTLTLTYDEALDEALRTWRQTPSR